MQVKGSIPTWAAGSLYRTGPGASIVENTKRGTHQISHWFDGLAHTHKFDLVPSTDDKTCTITYSSRRQAEDLVAHIQKKGWLEGLSFAQRADPCMGIYAKAMSVFNSSPTNYNVVVHRNLPGLESTVPANSGHRSSNGNIFVTTDTSGFQRIDKDTLEPIGVTNQSKLHPDLKGPFSCSHSKRDPENGDYFNVNLTLGRRPTYRVFRVSASSGKTDILASISGTGINPAYIHSFFLTENYVVLCIPSSHYAWSGAKILYERNLISAIQPFSKSSPCKWIVIDRRHGKGEVARFSTPAGFFFHSINAFEEQVVEENGVKRTDISLDYVHFDTTEIMHAFYYDIILNKNDGAKNFWLKNKRYENLNPRFVRQRFRMPNQKQKPSDVAEATASEAISIPGPHAGDLPTINPAYACKPYQYVFSTCNRGLSTISDALVKTDLHSRDALMWCGPAGHSPGEPIFIPRPGAEDEDDGVILSVILDGSAQRSYMLCLDAKTMTEMGRAEADFPIAVGLHGLHAPSKI